MPLTPSFAVSQSLGSSSILVITDTSSGSDVLVTSRRVYLKKSDGTYLVPAGVLTSYIPWPIADGPLSLDVLDADMGLSIKVDWLNVANAVLYTTNAPFVFTLYSEEFYYSLTQNQASDPSILQDTNYWNNKMILRVQIDDSENAVEIGSNISAAQASLDRAAYMISNEVSYF